MTEYLSVADFAVAAGVTKQAVYRRMDTNLKEYVRVENGKKFVSTDAIPLFHVEQPFSILPPHLLVLVILLRP